MSITTQQKPRSTQYKVQLLDCRNRPLFMWSGRAQDTSCAEKLARRAYDTSIAAIYKARGLTNSTTAVKLRPSPIW